MNGAGGPFDPTAPQPGGSALDAYLDGMMPPGDRAAFEKRLADDSALAAGAAAQGRIDAALAGLFVVPPFAGLPTNGHPPAHLTTAANGVARATLKAAKATLPYNLILGGLSILIVTVVSWLAYLQFGDPRKTVADVYHDAASARSMPQGCGGENESPQNVCSDLLGGRATLKTLPVNVHIIGMAIEPVLSQRTLVIRAKVDGNEVAVFVQDAATADRSARAKALDAGKGLHAYVREGGGMLLMEVTPFDRATLLDLFELPINPSCPTTLSPSPSPSAAKP